MTIAALRPLVEAWRSLNRPGLVRLALLDVDGCVTAGEASALSLPALARLQELNRLSTVDPAVPALALCTGRQEPYVELMTQAIGGFLPAIWETGAGLYDPAEYRFMLHPLLDVARLEARAGLRDRIVERVIRPGLARSQPGKEVSISLYPEAEQTIASLATAVQEALEGYADGFWLQSSVTTLEVLPRGIHKGVGVRWLLELLGLEREQAIGVGDSPADIEIFHATGLGATPANAVALLKQAADYVAGAPDSAGVLEILDWVIARNRARLG